MLRVAFIRLVSYASISMKFHGALTSEGWGSCAHYGRERGYSDGGLDLEPKRRVECRGGLVDRERKERE